MTSHKESLRNSWEQLDILARWALNDSFAGTKPPQEVWERIEERLEKQGKARGVAVWQSVWRGCGVVIGLLGGKGLSRTPSYYLNQGEVLFGRPVSLCWLTYQYDLPALLVNAI